MDGLVLKTKIPNGIAGEQLIGDLDLLKADDIRTFGLSQLLQPAETKSD